MAREYKNLVMSVAFQNPADLLDLFHNINTKVKRGIEGGEVEMKNGKAVWQVEYATNHQYQDRYIDGKFVRTYKSKL
jgi:hypothetical protein